MQCVTLDETQSSGIRHVGMQHSTILPCWRGGGFARHSVFQLFHTLQTLKRRRDYLPHPWWYRVCIRQGTLDSHHELHDGSERLLSQPGVWYEVTRGNSSFECLNDGWKICVVCSLWKHICSKQQKNQHKILQDTSKGLQFVWATHEALNSQHRPSQVLMCQMYKCWWLWTNRVKTCKTNLSSLLSCSLILSPTPLSNLPFTESISSSPDTQASKPTIVPRQLLLQ